MHTEAAEVGPPTTRRTAHIPPVACPACATSGWDGPVRCVYCAGAGWLLHNVAPLERMELLASIDQLVASGVKVDELARLLKALHLAKIRGIAPDQVWAAASAMFPHITQTVLTFVASGEEPPKRTLWQDGKYIACVFAAHDQCVMGGQCRCSCHPPAIIVAEEIIAMLPAEGLGMSAEEVWVGMPAHCRGVDNYERWPHTYGRVKDQVDLSRRLGEWFKDGRLDRVKRGGRFLYTRRPLPVLGMGDGAGEGSTA